jgi:hypothetical protein
MVEHRRDDETTQAELRLPMKSFPLCQSTALNVLLLVVRVPAIHVHVLVHLWSGRSVLHVDLF